MKIELTKEQYEQVVRALYITDHILHANAESDDEIDETFAETEQYFLSLADSFRVYGVAEYEEEYEQYFPTAEYEAVQDEQIFKYEADILEDQIVTVLARNELESLLEKKAMTPDEAMMTLLELENKYFEEIEQKGTKNLSL